MPKLAQIVEGMVYLEDACVVHGDLKSVNPSNLAAYQKQETHFCHRLTFLSMERETSALQTSVCLGL